MPHCPCVHNQKRRHFHTKTTSAKPYIYIGVGSRDLLTKHTGRWAYYFFPACCLLRFAAFFLPPIVFGPTFFVGPKFFGAPNILGMKML